MKDNNSTDLDTYRSISLLNNFKMIKDQAILELEIENSGYSYLDHLITANLPDADYLSLIDTAKTEFLRLVQRAKYPIWRINIKIFDHFRFI